MIENLTDYKSKLVQVMTWWQQIITWTSAGKNFDTMRRHKMHFTHMV